MNKHTQRDEKGFLTKLFSFNGVMNRLDYLIYGVIVPIVLIALELFLNIKLGGSIALLSLFVLALVIQLAASIKRARDRNENIIAMVIVLVLFSPLVMLYLLFAPSKELEEAKKKSNGLLYVLLGILALLIGGAVLPQLLTNNSENSKNKLVCLQMATLADTIEVYKMDRDNYPTTQEAFIPLLTDGNLPRDPLDLWGNKLHYINENGSFELISYGKDGIKSSDDILFSECH